MNIFMYELKNKIGSTFIWVGSIGFFTWVSLSMMDLMANEATIKVLNDMPEALRKAFGMQGDVSTPLGYFSMLLAMIYLVGAIFSCNLGLSAVSIEERDLTADFLISKPITRSKILTTKLLAALTHILIFSSLLFLVSYGSLKMFAPDNEFSLEVFSLMMLSFFILELVFFSMGLLISVLLKKMDSVLPFSLGISIGLYMLDAFDTLLKDTFLRYMIPYDYFDPAYINENGELKTYGLVISLALIAAFTGASYVLYKKRNIATSM